MNIDPNEMLPQFCPECGAGDEDDGYFRLPKGFPANPPCAECDRRARVRLFQAGFKAGYERERAFMDAMDFASEPAYDCESRVGATKGEQPEFLVILLVHRGIRD